MKEVRRFDKRVKFGLIILLSLGLNVSCGKKNKVNTATLNPSSNNTNSYSPVNASNVNLQQIKSQISCRNGVSRVSDIAFTATGGSFTGNSYKLTGTFSPGSINGNISNNYVGTNVLGDIIIVQKMINGSNVVGYNVILSLCEYNPLIVSGRSLSNFRTTGIVLNDDVKCGYGSISSAYTELDAAQYQYYQTAVVKTTFSPLSCNNGQL